MRDLCRQRLRLNGFVFITLYISWKLLDPFPHIKSYTHRFKRQKKNSKAHKETLQGYPFHQTWSHVVRCIFKMYHDEKFFIFCSFLNANTSQGKCTSVLLATTKTFCSTRRCCAVDMHLITSRRVSFCVRWGHENYENVLSTKDNGVLNGVHFMEMATTARGWRRHSNIGRHQRRQPRH